MVNAVVVSPHFDDAVLDCWYLVSKSDALVITVCGGLPPKGTHRFWDIVCGEFDSNVLVQKRAKENREALALSGSTQTPIDLDFLDSQYRKTAPSTDELLQAVLSSSPKDSLLLFPLAAGVRRHANHVDLRNVGIKLLKQGRQVAFYPDAPYMHLPNKPSHRTLTKLERQAEKLIGVSVKLKINDLDDSLSASKKTALKTYKTQYLMTNLFSGFGLTRLNRRRYEVTIHPV